MVQHRISLGSHTVSDSPETVAESTPLIVEENDSIDMISRTMKALVKKIQDLRHLGIENHKLPLPKICVVGDQSTGKSSLIEGMSEIKVPRSAGCCTRCPLEINLSDCEPDAPWTCKIFLMKKYIYSTQLANRGGRGKGLGPWVDQDPEMIPFVTITDKAGVQDALKWAQCATLNPSASHEDYIPGNNLGTDETTQVKFSPNVVRLDISAPRFPNLSFYDLPGVINVAEIDTEKYLVTLVENLVKQYISTSSCIVLLTLPMTDDATNSSAARIIREVGATSRTLGVLTKPDRIGYGEGYDQWKEILRGEKFTVGHSYYVVRNNPNPQVEHSQAREEEEEFFSSGPWRNELVEYSDRFGTRNLQMALSKLLKQQIELSLPGIMQQLQARAQEVKKELTTLPDPPSANIQFILSDKLNELNNAMHAHMNGTSLGSDYSLQKQWMKIAADFQHSLLVTRPTMRTFAVVENFTTKQPTSNPVGRAACDDDEGDCEITESRPSPNKRKVGTVEPDGGVKRQMKSPITHNTPRASQNLYSTEHFGRFKGPVKVFTLEEIREISSETYASGVPGLANPYAVEEMNKLSVMHWEQPMKEFLTATYELMEAFLMGKLDVVFSSYQRTALYGKLRKIIPNFLESLKNPHLRAANEFYQVEQMKPFTMATAAFQSAQREALDILKTKRQASRVMRFLESGDTLDGGRRVGPSGISDAQMGEDEYAKEIEIMAVSRAYYEIASSRFVDTLCQSVHTKLFFKCDRELHSVIIKELGILDNNASERCMELMVEDPERQKRRRDLKKEEEKLRKAMGSLSTIEEDAGSADVAGPADFDLLHAGQA
ncbi:dynamin GTPase [Blastomyces dermatitidis ER-3]|uniref:Dynamin GTPase n=1 Tax=Ajellomyces dermatitidis (strain ER-3 / ATCC MYA-2586) TaxID=559297 RepID=A0ABP2F6B6_AJEDR|nr:dynamin GTPase [Blastomyces dermatitidis ER-3]EEQ92645.2 dynamin GTPase [Blastomyces dermatitidis ER-3]